MRPSILTVALMLFLLVGMVPAAVAQDVDETKAKDEAKQADSDSSAAAGASGSSTGGTKKAAASKAKPKYPPHSVVLKDTKRTDGLITTYQKGNRLYFELSGSHYSSEFIVLIAIARGIGEGFVLGGMSWGFGDDWVWKFRKIDDRVQIVRRNVRFRAKKGSPESTAVEKAYTDSVLFSLPVVTKGPKGGDIIDVTPVFMSDLPQISRALPGFGFSASKSTWHSIKGFKGNVELEVAATYASSGRARIESVADSRGATINVHYSISKLPKTGYSSRMADDRVGYFMTVVKDYSKKTDRDRFVRYINRWNLKKAESGEKLSEPKEPLIFYLEKTVPFKYRKPIRDGILEWNKAFEKAGFIDAIKVRQQENSDTWDPEDINYNTFRWITSSAGFAMGPSRVNPYNGQILDADIIFDADFLHYWKSEYETFTPKTISAMTGGLPGLEIPKQGRPGEREAYEQHLARHADDPLGHRPACLLSQGMAPQLAFAATALLSRADPAKTAEQQEKLIMQGLKEVTMHEVGHTLGLRHNFKASTYLSLEEINDPEKTKDSGLVASVMDYNPANIVPKGMKQGDYFTTTIGPYDMWAIEYGYKPGTSEKDLRKIASRGSEPGLAYATDEDVPHSMFPGVEPDPHATLWDLGNDSIAYAKSRAKLVSELIPGLAERMTKEGETYEHARRTFNVLLFTYGNVMRTASRYVGGMNVSRSHRGDKDAKPPFEVLDVAKQREALALLEEHVFSDKPFQFPPELYNHLAPTRWYHWGVRHPYRPDYPVHDMISLWQQRILYQLLAPVTLDRIHDTELKVPADQDALTTAELIERLTKAIFSETETVKEGDYTNRKPAISSLRRNLQRNYQRRLSYLAMGYTYAPEDCQTIAYAQLTMLEGRIQNLLKSNIKLDSYSRAHLEESAARARKVIDAKLQLFTP